MQALVTITHSQISVFDDGEPDFNFWTDDHVAQGFSWREGHVSFGVPDHDGGCIVETQLVDFIPPLDDEVLRAIRVPFSASGDVFIATIVDEYRSDIPKGDYLIEFRLKPGNLKDDRHDHTYRIDIFFQPDVSKEFSILRRSDEMTSDRVLTTTAKPAI